MAWGWDESDEAHQKVYGQEKHEGKLSHELIAGAASFEAMKAWEDRQRKEGKPVKHSLAKEAIAGIVGSQIDRLVETKGLDAIDAHKAKKHAEENAHEMYDEHYGRHGDEYDPSRYTRHERFAERSAGL